MNRKNSIVANYKAIAEELETKKPKNQQQIYIEAVTKKRTPEEINQVIEAGATIISENRVQEASNKLSKIRKKTTTQTHLIGHLQSNKAKKAIAIFDTIETVDSLKILNVINRHAQEQNKIQEIYLQINIGNDPKKHGLDPKTALDIIRSITEYKSVALTGLMTILPFGLTEDETKKLYTEMKSIYNHAQQINPKIINLSMGMSNDYLIALDCGASHVRIGTAIFGPRE